MAVYTDVTEGELETFLREYPAGRLLSYKGIAEGSENSNFLLHTSAGAFILTLYEKRVHAEDLPFFLGLMHHLAEKGISCPLPVERLDGKLYGTLAGRPAALITFLEGMWMRRPTVAHCRELGKALAELHVAGMDFPLSRPNALAIDGWRKLWDGAKLSQGYVRMRERLETWLAKSDGVAPRRAARETFWLGRAALHMLVFDPLLPEGLCDAKARRALVEAMSRFDVAGRRAWHEAFGVRFGIAGPSLSPHARAAGP